MLYHADVYLPATVAQVPEHPVKLMYGPHARAAARVDRYGDLSRCLPLYLDYATCQLVEVETDDRGRVLKRVVRLPVGDGLDLVIAVGYDGFVRTVWGNRHDDIHRSLNRKRYVQPSH